MQGEAEGCTNNVSDLTASLSLGFYPSITPAITIATLAYVAIAQSERIVHLAHNSRTILTS